MAELHISIRWKITLVYAVLLSVLLFGACVIIVASTRTVVLQTLNSSSDRILVTTTLDRQITLVILPCLIGALLLVLGIGLWLAGRLLQPIAVLTTTAQHISDGDDLSRRIGVTHVPNDEVGQLAATFDAMLARLEKAFDAQQQFVADASHELKTPLAAILGHANLLRRHGQINPYLLAESITAIIDEGERMHRLVQGLLRMAQSDAALPIRDDCVDLALIAHTVVREMAPLAQERSLRFEVSSTNADCVVRGNADELRQVVLNLADNAFQATSALGSVTITITTPAINGQPCVVLKVKDTGCGIEPVDLPRIFDRFYQVDKARSQTGGNRGLGLAIGQAVIQRHGGKISVQSEVGIGSTFCVILPACTRQ